MANWTTTYTISQVLIIIVYILLCLTYFLKNRKHILGVNVAGHILQALSYALLNGFTGAAMNIIYVIRDTFFLVDEKNRTSTKINKRDWIVLLCFLSLIVVFTVFTYNGWKSLFSVIATSISTIAIWQKNTKVYKLLGIPISIGWLCYNIVVRTLFGIILESILLISIIIGCILDQSNIKQNNKQRN